MKRRNYTIEMLNEAFSAFVGMPELINGISRLIKNETHVSHWVNIFLRHDNNGILAIDLADNKKILQIETYQSLFPNYIKGLLNQKYSPVLEALMIVSNFKFNSRQCKKNAKIIADYINKKEYNLAEEDKFESFSDIAKYINWPRLIRENMSHGNFCNSLSHALISQAMDTMFLAGRANGQYHPGGAYEFLVITAYGVFNEEAFYYKILEKDQSITLSNTEIRDYLKDMVEVDFESHLFDDLVNKYFLDDFPLIAYISFALFKRGIDDFSDEFKVLARLT